MKLEKYVNNVKDYISGALLKISIRYYTLFDKNRFCDKNAVRPRFFVGDIKEINSLEEKVNET